MFIESFIILNQIFLIFKQMNDYLFVSYFNPEKRPHRYAS